MKQYIEAFSQPCMSPFLSDAAILACAAGLHPAVTARMIHAGRSVELAQYLTDTLSIAPEDHISVMLRRFRLEAEYYTPHERAESIEKIIRQVISRLRDPWEQTTTQERPTGMAMLTQAVILSVERGYPPFLIATLLQADRFSELVECLWQDDRLRSSERCTRQLQQLRAEADSFTLPERFRRSPEQLRRHVEMIAGRH